MELLVTIFGLIIVGIMIGIISYHVHELTKDLNWFYEYTIKSASVVTLLFALWLLIEGIL